jgi:hypothetical protein
MVWEHKDVLVLNLALLLEVLTELSNTSVYSIESSPVMTVKLQFPPLTFLIDMALVKLSKMEREPIENKKTVSLLSFAKARTIFVVRNRISILVDSMSFRSTCAILACSWLSIRSEIVLSVMTKTIPGMTYPHNSDHHCLFAYSVSIELVTHFLDLVIACNNLIFSSILYNDNFVELPDILEKMISILSILICVFPN